jgi:hypothetical protein
MWTKGSNSLSGTPAKARRTGNPSPSNPDGAVVRDLTGRAREVDSSLPGADGTTIFGRAKTLSTVTAGINDSPFLLFW